MASHGTLLVRSARTLIVLVALSPLAGCTAGPASSSGHPTTAAPPGTSGPSTAAADICDGYGAGGWSFAAEASDNHGLVLTGARLGPRQLVRQISVPYIEITADWRRTGHDEMRRFELTRTPVSGHADVSAALMTGNVVCQGSGTTSVSASAEYVVQGLPSGATMLIWQSYRFDSGTVGCEPSEKLPCTRFWPTVEWGANAAAAGFLKSVQIVQRLQFDPDSGSAVAANIYRDRNRKGALLTGTSVQTLGRGSLKKETTQLVISSGRRNPKPLVGGCSPACTWDSVHLTDRSSTSSPGDNPFDPTPGCSECVHIHWAWGTASNTICKGKGIMGCNHVTGTPFTDGRPEIVDGSPQTAYLSVVRYSPDPDEIDPVLVKPTTLVQKRTCPTGGYQCLVNAQSLAHGQDVLFWDMTSTGTKTPGAIVINGTTMATGDAAWPQLTNFKHGGNGSMFFAPARILTRAASRVSIVPAAPASAIHYPRYSPLGPQERWVLPVRITYACMDEATTQGPFWLALNIDRSGILNADPAAGAEPGNPAYVTVRAGITPATGPVVLGDRVTAMRCASSRLPLTLTTYIEFAHPPTTADLDSLTLLGTPDGTADFEAWVPPSAPAAPQTSPSPTVPAQDAPDTDYQLAIKAGWQYNAFEPEEMGITLASTGDGLADELGIDNESGAQPGLSVSGPGYVLPGSTAGSKSECFSRLVNNDEYGVGLWYPGGVDPLPWDRLGQGVQACINSGGNIISLLTVLAPWDGNQIVVDAKSWKCTPPAGESVC